MDQHVRSYYENDFHEDDRLRVRAHGVLERVRTQELLTRLLPPPPVAVLDVGGGTGVHAAWLAEHGDAVHLVDPVKQHAVRAAQLAGVTAAVGDARDLVETDDSWDVVLLLGPLYHLPERADRLRALAEARRVARPGAPVIAAGISRYATLMDLGSDGRLTAEAEPFLMQLHATGHFRAGVVGFTTAYMHRPDELAAELSDAGLHRVSRCTASKGPPAPPCACSA